MGGLPDSNPAKYHYIYTCYKPPLHAIAPAPAPVDDVGIEGEIQKEEEGEEEVDSWMPFLPHSPRR